MSFHTVIHTAPGFSVLDPTTTCDLSVAYGVVPSELAPPLPPATRGGTQEVHQWDETAQNGILMGF